MSRAFSYVAAYDVADDRERNRVVKTLEGFGFRVQKSVFECDLDEGLKRRLCNAVDKLQLQTGYVYLYRLHANVERVDLGAFPPRQPETHAIII